MFTYLNTLERGAAALILAASFTGALAGMPVSAHRAADTATEVDGPNILRNGGFEAGADPGSALILPASSPLLQGWTVEVPGTERQVYYVGSLWQAEEGTRSVGFRLSQFYFTQKKQVPDIKQAFPTTVGQRYRVVFYEAVHPWHKNNPMILRMTVAGQTRDYTYQADQNAALQHMEWVKRSFVFTATTASTTIEFSPQFTTFDDGPLLGLDNVQVRAIQSAAGGQTPGTGPGAQPAPLTVKLAAASLASGAQQTIQATAANGASVALVVDYPDGSQLVVPGHAGSDGHYSYSWALPSSVHGTVKVWLDAGGSVAQATFTVS
jgi:hypothetical protein